MLPATPVSWQHTRLGASSSDLASHSNHLVVVLGDTPFGIPLSHVQGVESAVQAVAVPHAAPWLCGVAGLRGEIVTVIDLPTFFGFASPRSGAMVQLPSGRSLVTRWNDSTYLCVVTAVRQLMAIEQRSGLACDHLPSSVIPFVRGATMLEGTVVYVLDLRAALASDAMQTGASVFSGERFAVR